MKITTWLLGLIVVTAGCSASPRAAPSRDARAIVHRCIENGRFTDAMKQLHAARMEWEREKAESASSLEGADGLWEHHFFQALAVRGDRAWGEILDSPDDEIAHSDKVLLIIEILVHRMGMSRSIRLREDGVYEIDAN